MIYNDIKHDMLQALKEKRLTDKEVLSFLYSQLKNKAIDLHIEELSDQDTLQVIQKTLKSLQEEKEVFNKAERFEKVKTLELQIELLNTYLPKQLSELEIKEIINNLPEKTLPYIMRYFKDNYSGKVDMKVVNTVAKSI